MLTDACAGKTYRGYGLRGLTPLVGLEWWGWAIYDIMSCMRRPKGVTGSDPIGGVGVVGLGDI